MPTAPLSAIGCALITAALLFVLLKTRLAWRIAVDNPNHRSLHAAPVPRIGGLVVIGTAAIGMSLTAPRLQLLTVVAVGLMLVSAIDDRRGLPIWARLIAHVVACVVAAVALLPAAPWWLIGVVAAGIVWSINLYNFMDGADGLAGGMAAFGFGSFAVVAFAADAQQLAVACACIAGAASGFLLYNFHPARVFLGDAGSVPLGFLASSLGVAGWAAGVWPGWFPLLVFSPFVVDASATILLRALRRQRIWEAHRDHLYQRMVKGGYGHRATVFGWYTVMALTAMSAVIALRWPFKWQIGILVGWAAVYAVAYTAFGRLLAQSKNEA